MANSNFRTLTLDKLDGVASTRNYIKNGSALQNVKGWATYADAAGTSPVDGTGGSPTVTWTRTTSSPLSLDASFLFTKDAASRQGQGASYDFTIDRADQAKVCRIDFDYEVASGTYADGDLTVWLYDVTNAQLIQPSASSILNAIGPQKKQPLSFQTNSNSTSYRLIIHVASTSASAYTVKFDNVSVVRESISQGTVVTDWVSYTPTIGVTGGTTSASGKWRRVGSDIEVWGDATFTTVFTGGAMTVGLPSGLSIDTSKFPVAPSAAIGIIDSRVYLYDVGSGQYAGTITYQDTSSVLIRTLQDDVGASGDYVFADRNITTLLPFTWANNDRISFQFKVPILGWASSQQLSSDADTRVVAGWVGGASQSITSGAGPTTVIYGTKVEDTHGDTYNTSTGAWTCKIPGWYQFDYQIVDGTITPAAADRSIQISLGVDGAGEYGIAQIPTLSTVTRGITLKGSFKLKLRAGQVVRVNAESSLGDSFSILNNTGYCYLQWSMIQGPAQIAASEQILVKAQNGAGTSFTGGAGYTDIPFATEVYDTHGSFATPLFTAPAPGYYEMTVNLYFGAVNLSTSQAIDIQFVNNGTAETKQIVYGTGVSRQFSLTATDTYYLLAGQTLKARTATDVTASLVATAARNYVTIKRLGGVG